MTMEDGDPGRIVNDPDLEAVIDLRGGFEPSVDRLRPPTRDITNSRSMLVQACEWMRYFAFTDAFVPEGPAPMIDSFRGVAWVESSTKVVGRREIEAFDAIASKAAKYGVYFALVGYSSKAISTARSAGVALFRLDNLGRVEPVDDLASRLLIGSDRRHLARATGPRTQG